VCVLAIDAAFVVVVVVVVVVTAGLFVCVARDTEFCSVCS